MWNRDDEKDDEPTEAAEARSEAAPSGGRRDRPGAGRQAIIGDSITIRGEVTGDEDLTIQGHVDGSVELDEHAVTVGPDGRVDADIVARVINVEGRVDGDLDADERVVLRGTARVEGDISAPRVVLDDGSYFRGAVDMDDASGAGRGSGTASRTSSRSSSGAASVRSGTGTGGADSGGDAGA